MARIVIIGTKDAGVSLSKAALQACNVICATEEEALEFTIHARETAYDSIRINNYTEPHITPKDRFQEKNFFRGLNNKRK